MLIRLAMVIAALATANGRTLLPQPKEVRFGVGKLPIRGATIGFAQSPSEEDRLAGAELARILTEACGSRVTLLDSQGTITLRRTSNDSSWTWDDSPGPDSSEAYRIRIAADGATVESRTARGLYYAVQTIRQLIDGAGRDASLPEAEIGDWPSMRLRGYMLDFSHGPFPKVDEVKRQLDFLARWKTNQFYLYSETNIELKGHALLSPRARLTQSEVREIVDYARRRFIDVVPCVELYGHLHDLVRIERYSELGEMAHGGELNPRDPRSLELVRNWVSQFTDLFPSQFFHVGLDETYELGKAPGRELDTEAAGKLYLEFFEKVAAIVAQRGRRVMVWADILLQHPEVIPRLPKGVIALPWRYADEPSYDRFVEPLARGGATTMVTSGIWNYYEAAPDFDHTIRNVNGLMASGRKFNSVGLLHTAWTDHGQVLMRMALPAMAYGPIASWLGEPMNRDDFYVRYAAIVHPGSATAISKALARISEAQSMLETALNRRVMLSLWTDPFEPAERERTRRNADRIRLARRASEDAQESLLAALARRNDSSLRSLLFGARVIDYVALKFLYALELEEFHAAFAARPGRERMRLLFGIETSDHTHSRLFDLMNAAGELREELRLLWLEEYTPYRLQTALGRWQGEFERWRVLQQSFAKAAREWREGSPVPAFETLTSER